MPTNSPPIPGAVAGAGPLILGYLFNWGLYGVLIVQVYLYYLAFPRDRVGTKCLVLGVYLAETLQTALATHDAFMTFGVNYGNIAALSEGQLSGVTVPVLSGIISCTVQLFYIYRIFILSGKSKPLVLVLCSIALAQGCAGIVTGIQTMQVGDLSRLQESDVFVSCTVWLVCAAVCDVIIAISMYYWLSKSETGFRATNVLISKLIRLSIETGSLTAMVATLEITLFLAFPGTDYHTAPALILAKLYSNSLIVTFNSRLRIVDGRAAPALSSIELNPYSSTWADGKTWSKPVRRRMGQGQPGGDNTRQIEVTVDVQHDNWGNKSTAQSEGKVVTLALGDSTEGSANLTQ